MPTPLQHLDSRQRVGKLLGEFVDFLVNPENYTRNKLDEIEEHLKKVNKDILYTVVQFLKNAVAENEISDIKVLRFLEKRLNITLIDLR